LPGCVRLPLKGGAGRCSWSRSAAGSRGHFDRPGWARSNASCDAVDDARPIDLQTPQHNSCGQGDSPP
jgi:hypothetical protein